MNEFVACATDARTQIFFSQTLAGVFQNSTTISTTNAKLLSYLDHGYQDVQTAEGKNYDHVIISAVCQKKTREA